MYPQSLISLAVIVSEKYIVFTYSNRKALVTKFDLVIKMSRSTQGHFCANYNWPRVLDASYQVSRELVICFGEDFLRVFTIYGHGGHLCHVARLIKLYFLYFLPQSQHNEI